MKKSLIVLSVILAVLLVFATILIIKISDKEPVASEVTVPAVSEKTTGEETEEPVITVSETTVPVTSAPETTVTEQTEPSKTEEPTETTTEAPTEPPVLESSEKITANGVSLRTFTEEGHETVLAEAQEYLSALGLLRGGSAHRSDRAKIRMAADGMSVTIGKKTYDFVSDEKLYVPIYEIAEFFHYPVWKDEEEGVSYITPGARKFELPENVNVPVLIYHTVSDNCWGYEELFMSPSSMEEQLKYLVENDYDPIWFEDLAHIEDYDKPVLLTFDDGYDDNYLELFPLLKKYNVKATIFVIGRDTNGDYHKMNEEQIREISDSGLVSVQAHGYTHENMDAMDEETLRFEMGETKKVISRLTGKVPYVLCYPSGRYSSLTLDLIEEYYDFGIKMNGGLYNTSADSIYEISRYYMPRWLDIGSFASYISAAGT